MSYNLTEEHSLPVKNNSQKSYTCLTSTIKISQKQLINANENVLITYINGGKAQLLSKQIS